MPYYSELGIYTPTSSYTNSLLKGPYSAHSSIIASNFLPPSKFRPPFRNYKPHLTTISESANIPKYITPKVRVRPVKINTADIEASLRYHPAQRSQKDAKPNREIRRDRATIRLQTIHKDTVEKEIGQIKSWRDNFKPDELSTDSKRHKKTPGELLKEKFLIRCKSKENLALLKNSPSFKDICQVITTDDENLNPGQPLEVRRRQSRQFSHDDIMKEIQRSSSSLSVEEVQILDALIQAENEVGLYEPVKKKKKKSDIAGEVRKNSLVKDAEDISEVKVNSKTVCEPDAELKKDTFVKDIPDFDKKSSQSITNVTDKSSVKAENVPTSRLRKAGSVKNMVKDISQVEIEMIPTKQKPVIKGHVGDITKKNNIKLVVEDMKIEESPKKEKKFRFNVTVQEFPVKKKILLPEQTSEEIVSQTATPQKCVVTSILKKQNKVTVGHIQKPKVKKVTKELKKPEEVNSFTVTVSPPGSGKFKVMSIQGEKSEKNEAKADLKIEDISIKQQNVDEESEINVAFKLPRNDISNQEKSETVTGHPKIAEHLNPDEKVEAPGKNSETVEKSIPEMIMNSGEVECENGTESSTEILNILNNEKLDNVKPEVDKIQVNDDNKNTSSGFEKLESENVEADCVQNMKPDPDIISTKNITKKDDKTPNEVTCEVDVTRNQSLKSEEKPLKKKIAKKIKSVEKVKKQESDEKNGISDEIESNQKTSDIVKTEENEVNIKIVPLNDTEDAPNIWTDEDTYEPPKLGKLKLDQKNPHEILKEIQNGLQHPPETPEEKQNRIMSKRSLIQKANKSDPDLNIFEPPTPPITDEKEPSPEPSFVPLKSNSFSKWMHPWKKPEQTDECLDIYAKPKFIRARHIPRRWRTDTNQSDESEDSTTSEEESSDSEEDDDDEDEEQESSTQCNVGVSTSSIDSGFESGRKNKGSIDSRDSPGNTLNPASNPAFSLDFNDLPEEVCKSSTYQNFQKSGRITPPATTIPRFRKYCVDDFNFLKVLGKGSFGKVLLAELKGTEYYYAVKCLKKDVVLEDDDVECTLIERKVLALGTKHPYLCHLLCTFQTESHLFFVMEYLNGGDLMFHIQAERRFSEARARFYGAEIVSGLRFLHNKGIVYRDLKLDNILLDFDGHVRIADFGMCKLQIFLDRMADTFCGTPDYMAPEIIKGQHYNQCVDWWSFGVLLYEMLLGQSPFSGSDEDELFWSICNEKPVIPRFLSAEAGSVLLQECRVDYRYSKLIYIIYKNATMTTELFESIKCIQIGRGVRRGGDTISPKLFVIVLEYAPQLGKKALIIDSQNLTTLPFAEDIVLFSDNLEDIQDMLPELQSVCAGFLEKDGNKRLGHRFSPHGDIQDHPFFKPIDWTALEARQLEPPFKPNLHHPLDTQYFDRTFTTERAKLTPIENGILQSMDQTQFQGFSYTNPNATDK